MFRYSRSAPRKSTPKSTPGLQIVALPWPLQTRVTSTRTEYKGYRGGTAPGLYSFARLGPIISFPHGNHTVQTGLNFGLHVGIDRPLGAGLVFHEIHPVQSLIVAALLALLPYPFLRGLMNRIVCRWRRSHGGPRRDVAA